MIFFMIAIIVFIIAIIALTVYLIQMHQTKEHYLGRTAVDTIARQAAEKARLDEGENFEEIQIQFECKCEEHPEQNFVTDYLVLPLPSKNSAGINSFLLSRF